MMVGAADGIDNVNAVAEFNAWVDPEAPALVFAAPQHGAGSRMQRGVD